MKLNYYPDTDSLYIDLSERPSVESREISEGVVFDYDAQGKLVVFDVDNDEFSLGIVIKNNAFRNLPAFNARSLGKVDIKRVCVGIIIKFHNLKPLSGKAL